MRGNKRKKDEISDYIEKVDAKEIDGEYDSVDLAAKNHKDQDRVSKSLEREKFEIHALLYNGKPTGYGSCSSQRCKNAMWSRDTKCTFLIQNDRKAGSKWQLVERHLLRYHQLPGDEPGTSKNRPAAKPTKARQTKIDSFTASKKLPQSVVDEMIQHTIDVVASRHTSLNFFSKEEVRIRDGCLLKAGGYHPNEALRFDRTGPTIAKDLERKSATNKELIAEVAGKLAENRVLALAMDHHDIKNLGNQKIVGVNPIDGTTADGVRPKSAFGLQLILCAEGERHAYMLKYVAVTDKKNSTTLRWAREVLQESA